MRTKRDAVTLTGTSPSAASTTAVGAAAGAGVLANSSKIVVDATITGATGGTLDVYVQRKIAADTWRDMIHFPQAAAGAAAKRYTCVITGEGSSLVEVGTGSDAAATPALAANTVVNVIPGSFIRLVLVSGAGTSVGAAQTVTFTPYEERD